MIISRWLIGLASRNQVARKCGSIRRRGIGRSLSDSKSSLVSAFGSTAAGEMSESVEQLEDRALLSGNGTVQFDSGDTSINEAASVGT